MDCVPLPVDIDGFEVEYEIVVAPDAHDQLDSGAARDCEASVTTPYVLVNGAVVHAVIRAFNVDGLVGPDRDVGSWFDPRESVAIIVAVSGLRVCQRC